MKTKDFSDYLLAIGEGRIECIKENFENDIIEIKPEMLVNDNELDLINIVFPNIRTEDKPEYYTTRSILSAKNIDVDKFNSLATDMFPGNLNYLKKKKHNNKKFKLGEKNIDLKQETSHLYPTEFLNSVNISRMPLHKLELKIGQPAICLRRSLQWHTYNKKIPLTFDRS